MCKFCRKLVRRLWKSSVDLRRYSFFAEGSVPYRSNSLDAIHLCPWEVANYEFYAVFEDSNDTLQNSEIETDTSGTEQAHSSTGEDRIDKTCSSPSMNSPNDIPSMPMDKPVNVGIDQVFDCIA